MIVVPFWLKNCGRTSKKGRLINPGNYIINTLIFGGAKYKEPIVAEGPFVMNSNEALAIAYQDFYLGKYGEIDFMNY